MDATLLCETITSMPNLLSGVAGLVETAFITASPLEGFSIITLIPCSFDNKFFLSFTNSSLFILLASGLFLLLLKFATLKGGFLVPTRSQSLVELIYEFIANLVKEQVGENGYFPIIFALFAFILSCNLIGMVPFAFTATSHFVVTFALSFSVFIGITLVGFQTHGLHFFSFLLPPGAPLVLAPLLVVLELVSYGFRAVSLGVRLFANMMAGHTLVKILAGFSWTMLSVGSSLVFIAAFIPLFIVFALTGLEIGVGILQAYVFTILTCIYLNDATHLHRQ